MFAAGTACVDTSTTTARTFELTALASSALPVLFASTSQSCPAFGER
jgi:hypothetical protein